MQISNIRGYRCSKNFNFAKNLYFVQNFPKIVVFSFKFSISRYVNFRTKRTISDGFLTVQNLGTGGDNCSLTNTQCHWRWTLAKCLQIIGREREPWKQLSHKVQQQRADTASACLVAPSSVRRPTWNDAVESLPLQSPDNQSTHTDRLTLCH